MKPLRALALTLGLTSVACSVASSGIADGAGGSGPAGDAPSGTGGVRDGGGTGNGGSGAFDSAGAAASGTYEKGKAGCGLDAAAFCETFDHASPTHGRAGDLDPSTWSAGRLQPQLPTAGGALFAIRPATVPACRSGTAAKVLPSSDALICDPNDGIASSHLMVAVAAQNYGINSYRVRQPFDFAGRTGKIVFDAEAYASPLLGWISVEVTEDPIAVPSYGVIQNDEGGILPKNGFEMQFSYTCNTDPSSKVSPTAIHVFDDYADTVIDTDFKSDHPAPCVDTKQGRLNHFEIQVSQNKIELYGSGFSADGITFATPQLLYAADVNLPFTRGYLHISTHNHATLKYSMDTIDAWVARWDNVGFDGPIIANGREYEIPDSLTPGPNGTVNLGYVIADEALGPHDVLHFRDVNLDHATAAWIALSAWCLTDNPPFDGYVVKYRLNHGSWHDRALTKEEITALGKPIVNGQPTGGSQGALGQMLEVPLQELVTGDNTFEVVASHIPQNYPPAMLNVDLGLTTTP